MRVLHLIAGAGPMYCGSCLHGNALATALGDRGVDVVLLPLYTPLRTDEDGPAVERLALGGISVYLQQKWSWFRRAPRLLDWVLDRPALVRWAARRGSWVRPEDLGALTISVLQAEEGRLRREAGKLLRSVKEEIRPDLVHLSNVMLAGLAGPIRRRLGVPVVATLSGEDGFLDRLPQPWCDEARALLRRRAADLDGMTALNGYYADFMAGYLDVPRGRIDVIRPGLNLRGYQGVACGAGVPPAQGNAGGTPAPQVTIGYLGRVCHAKGVHLLVDAVGMLAEDSRLPPARVRAAGYLDPSDRSYLRGIEQRASDLGLSDRFEYVGEVAREAKIAFLESLDVACLPSIAPESKGLPALEAWAAGVPVVAPAHGAFCEMMEDTGGGMLYEPGSTAALADGLRWAMTDRRAAALAGQQAQRVVFQRYTASRMAQEMMDLYARVVGGGR